jgi:hypothetical protein
MPSATRTAGCDAWTSSRREHGSVLSGSASCTPPSTFFIGGVVSSGSAECRDCRRGAICGEGQLVATRPSQRGNCFSAFLPTQKRDGRPINLPCYLSLPSTLCLYLSLSLILSPSFCLLYRDSIYPCGVAVLVVRMPACAIRREPLLDRLADTCQHPGPRFVLAVVNTGSAGCARDRIGGVPPSIR